MPRAAVRVLGAVALVAAAIAFTVQSEPVRGIDLDASRLISSEPLPEVLEACSWDLAAPERPAGGALNRASLQTRGAGAGQPQSIGDPNVAARMPIRTIRDPYAGFAAIRVDPVHNEVVVMDEFKFNIYVYDRLAVTPASAPQTTPKRFIGGGKTLSRYNSDGYVDTKTGDIYIVNNDSEPGVFKFPRTAEGNVEPASELVTPYGAFGMTVDEDRGEMFFTIQHDGAIQIYRKGATGEDNTASRSIRRPGCCTWPTTAPSGTKRRTRCSRCPTRSTASPRAGHGGPTGRPATAVPATAAGGK
jgi:hypothetical protein